MRATIGLVLGVVLWCAPGANGETLNVYSSLPLQGANARQTKDIVRAMRLALREAGGRAGAFDIKYVSLDSSTRQAGNWDPGRVAQNARDAARDKRTILYLGEFNSGASAIAIPIVNQANISQISPSNTYAGLTVPWPADARGEPQKYYPTGKRTYFRLPGHDGVQAAALVTQARDDGCARLVQADDGDIYGLGLARTVQQQATRIGLPLAAYVRKARSKTPAQIAAAVARANADCFLYSGVTANRAVPIVTAVAKRLPGARLYGGDGVCESGFTKPMRAFAARFRCTISTLAISDYPGGAAFAQAFGAAYAGRSPDPYAIAGYEAMKLGLDTITALGAAGNRREAVRKALFATRDRNSVLGTYSIDRNGDTTLRDFGVYRATSAGRLRYDHRIVAE